MRMHQGGLRDDSAPHEHASASALLRAVRGPWSAGAATVVAAGFHSIVQAAWVFLGWASSVSRPVPLSTLSRSHA
jgi:hypothetical protein